MFHYMHILYNDQIRVTSKLIASNICHFFVVRTFRILSSSYFEMYNIFLLTIITVPYDRTPELIPSI